MDLMEQNFAIAAELDERAAIVIQSMLRLLDINTTTRIRLENPQPGGNQTEFALLEGDYADLDKACAIKHIRRFNNTLEV